MATDMLLDFYESINFELIDIDGYDTLFTELLDCLLYTSTTSYIQLLKIIEQLVLMLQEHLL